MLDDGRLTDAQGRTVDFKHTVVIMTSNLGADRIQEHARTRRVLRAAEGGPDGDPAPAASGRSSQPDRRDHRLPRADRGAAAEITRLLLDRARRGGCTRSGSSLEFTDEAVDFLAQRDTTRSTARARCAGRSQRLWRTSCRGSCSAETSSPATASRSRSRTASSGSTSSPARNRPRSRRGKRRRPSPRSGWTSYRYHPDELVRSRPWN